MLRPHPAILRGDAAMDMVTVDGIRYRPEDAPRVPESDVAEVEVKQAPEPANKARRPRAKSERKA